MVCNGVGRPSSDLWLGGGGAEAESAFRDVLMETESERERNSNLKSTHSSTGPSRQVSNSKSAPNPTSTTTRQKSNSNPNLKSAPSVSTTTTTTTAHSSSLRRNQSEEEERQEIDVDTSKLVAVFDRVVSESAEVSVEVMEKMLSTFNHLVFRYRMTSDRRQLPRVRKGLNLLCVWFRGYFYWFVAFTGELIVIGSMGMGLCGIRCGNWVVWNRNEEWRYGNEAVWNGSMRVRLCVVSDIGVLCM